MNKQQPKVGLNEQLSKTALKDAVANARKGDAQKRRTEAKAVRGDVVAAVATPPVDDDEGKFSSNRPD